MASPMESSPTDAGLQAMRPNAASQEAMASTQPPVAMDLSRPKTPTQNSKQVDRDDHGQDFPDIPPPFDWDGFERRYEAALREAGQAEEDILKEAENLSKFFRVWASAASAHDDERAAKRLLTRRRFVNLSEKEMGQKQQHYEDVLHAFENAMALLRSK